MRNKSVMTKSVKITLFSLSKDLLDLGLSAAGR